MKKLLSLVAALGVSFCMMTSVSANEIVYIEMGGDSNGVYTPGITYYWPAYDGSYRMTDEYTDVYKTKIEVTEGKKYVSGVKLVRRGDGYYYFTFRGNPSYAYDESADIEVVITSTDKQDKEYVYTTTLNFSIGYGGIAYVGDLDYDVDSDMPVIEFEDGIDFCTLNFDDVANYHVNLGSSSKVKRYYNVAFTTEENEAIVEANPDANMTFLSFYARPLFPKTGVLKIYAPDANYLYTYDSYNELVRIEAPNNNGYFGLNTDQLSNYVASDIPLKSTGGTISNLGDAGEEQQTEGASGSIGADASALSQMISTYFSNPFVVVNYGASYTSLGKTIGLQCKPDLSGLDTKSLMIYAYDEVNNQLLLQTNAAPKVEGDTLYFNSSVGGYYVITDAPLAAK